MRRTAYTETVVRYRDDDDVPPFAQKTFSQRRLSIWIAEFRRGGTRKVIAGGVLRRGGNRAHDVLVWV